jgi:hypothetical protein
LASTLAPLVAASKTGFETTIAACTKGPYVAAQALDHSGAILGNSATVKD